MAKMKPHVPEKRKSPVLEKSKKKDYGPGGPSTPGAKRKKSNTIKRSKNRKGKLSN